MPFVSKSRSTLLALALVLPISGIAIAQTEGMENVPVAELATRMKDLIPTGKWKTTMSQFDMDGKMTQPEIVDGPICQTQADQAENISKMTSALVMLSETPGCKIERSLLGSGKLDAAIACEKDGKSATISIKGSFSPEKFDIDLNFLAKGPNAPQSRQMKVSAVRLGDC